MAAAFNVLRHVHVFAALRTFVGVANVKLQSATTGNLMSKSLLKRLATLIACSVKDVEGRKRAVKTCR